MGLSDLKEATPGKCDPKPVCITNPLVSNLNSSQVCFPQCINIHRCDGCCPPNEKCVAIKSSEVKLRNVGIINFVSDTDSRFSDNIITVLNHTECQCQCQWETDDDCRTVNQNYVKKPDACECYCPEEVRCSPFHEFNHELCACKCKHSTFSRMEENCKSRGFIWNENFCK